MTERIWKIDVENSNMERGYYELYYVENGEEYDWDNVDSWTRDKEVDEQLGLVFDPEIRKFVRELEVSDDVNRSWREDEADYYRAVV